MQRSDPKSPHPLTAIACLAVFAALLLMPYFHGHWRLADDSYEFALPALRFQQRVLALGQWPHWNLGEGFGKPTAINSGSMFFYPFAPLWGWLVGWSEASYLSFLFLHLFAGAGLAYRFSRKVGLTLEASVFFALAFIGNGYALGFFSNFSLLIPYLFWPLLGEGLWRLHQSRGAWRTDSLAVAQIAGATVLIETSGYPLTRLLIYQTPQESVSSKSEKRSFSKTVVHELTNQDGYRCSYIDPGTQKRCSSSFGLEIDHVQAWSFGGKSELSNARYLCKPHHGRISFLQFGASSNYFKPK